MRYGDGENKLEEGVNNAKVLERKKEFNELFTNNKKLLSLGTC